MKSKNPDCMSADEIAAFLNMGRRQVYEAANRGDIPCRRVGKRLIFFRPAIVEWLHGRGEGSSDRAMAVAQVGDVRRRDTEAA